MDDACMDDERFVSCVFSLSGYRFTGVSGVVISLDVLDFSCATFDLRPPTGLKLGASGAMVIGRSCVILTLGGCGAAMC